MHCQKCKSPLRLDSSLYNLDPAAFKLLVNAPNPHSPEASPSSLSKGKGVASTPGSSRAIPKFGSGILPSHQQDRLARYEAAAKDARPASIIKQSYTQPRTKPVNPNMSF